MVSKSMPTVKDLPETVTVKLHLAVLRASSVNSYVTSVVGGFSVNPKPGL